MTTEPMSYRQVLRDRRLAGLLGGDVISKVGDGMLLVALPLQVLTTYDGQRPAVAIGLVAAAPFVLSTAVSLRFGLGRASYDPRTVMVIDSALRACAVGGTGIAALVGVLPVWALAVVLLVGSGLRLLSASSRRLTATGMAGERGRFSVNGLLGTSDSLALYIAGPALGGALAAATRPGAVLMVSGCTCLALLTAVVLAVPAKPAPTEDLGQPAPTSGWITLRAAPVAATLFAVVFAFNLFYMPVEIALPLLVQGPLKGTASSLGLIWTSFGLGALAGAIATNQLRRLPQGPLLLAVIGGWTVCIAVLAAAPNTLTAAAALSVGGFIYAPFTPIAYSLVQDRLTPAQRQPVITLWAAGTVLAAPIGLVLGGPLVQATGDRGGLLASTLLTAALLPVAAWGLSRARPPSPR